MDVSDEPSVTLIGATTSPLCADAGVAQGTLALRVAEYLTKASEFSHRRFRDYAGWADVAENFSGYREKLLHIGGASVGADTGNLATDVQLGSAAQELLRKGIEVLLTVDLSCTPHPVRHGDWEYAFQVHKIDLKKLAEGPSDSRQGLSVDGVLETDSETVQSQSDLYRAVSTPIARLLDIPYVRFVELRQRRPRSTTTSVWNSRASCPVVPSPLRGPTTAATSVRPARAIPKRRSPTTSSFGRAGWTERRRSRPAPSSTQTVGSSPAAR